jgi:two-component system response regulator NreC
MATSGRLRILLAEDHALVREGLKRLVNDQRDMEVVAEAGDGPEAVRLAQTAAPDLALLDVSMPIWDGVKTARMLRAACPAVKIIAVTRHDDPSFVTRMLEAGASGYVLKQSLLTELIDAIRAVTAGAQHVDPAIQPAPRARDAAAPGETACPRQPLSPIEQYVLRLIARARSTQQIAHELAIDADAVASIKSTAMRKAGLETRVQVIRYAAEQGWIDRG